MTYALLLIIGIVGGSYAYAGGNRASSVGGDLGNRSARDKIKSKIPIVEGENCRKTAPSSYSCTDSLTEAKAKLHPLTYIYVDTLENQIVTAYVCERQVCINARGLQPTAGQSIACPRHIKLGTRVTSDDTAYTCDDRYNLRLSQRWDIYLGVGEAQRLEALQHGKKRERVTINYK